MPQQRGLGSRRFLATVLFTDIVGSTERAAELGDREWRRLVERHHAVVRRELRRFHGREMDTAGDGFFAVFDTPEAAVRCAAAISAAVADLDLQIRAGVHVGEVERVGGKVGGMAVHVGARIGGQAEPGRVLVSSSVRDMTVGSGLRFEDAGTRELKGVAEPWHLFDLVTDGPAEQKHGHRRAVRVLTRRSRRRVLLGVAAGLALVAVAVPVLILRQPAAPAAVVAANSVGVLDASGTRPAAAVRVGQRPSGIAAGLGSVWVSNSASDTVSRIDPKTYAVVPIPVGSGPTGIAVGAGAVWVANGGDGTVSRISPETNSVVQTINGRPGPAGVLVAAGSIWVTNALDASVSRIEPGTNRVRRRLPVGAGPTGITYGAGSVWVTNSGDGTVSRLDPRTGKPDGAPIRVGNGPAGIAVGAGGVWVANTIDGSLSRIDPTDSSVRTIAAGGGAYGVAAHGDTVWVSNEYAGTLSRVDPKRLTVQKTLRTDGAPLGLTFVGDRLWFGTAGGGAALHRGGVLTIATPRVGVFVDPPLDPGNNYDAPIWQLLAITNDGLVGFRRTTGVQGAQLVPDLAASLPAPTDNGRTYLFHLRPNIRYSTGAKVQPSDIRRGIERTFHNVEGPKFLYGVIRGGTRCLSKPNECDLRAGIVADDRANTVTFHLSRPDPAFLHKLALPPAYAVPSTVATTLRAGGWVPATGPYMVKSYLPSRQDTQDSPTRRGRLELVRNPHFRQWSQAAQPDGYPARIVFDSGLTDSEAVQRVTDGKADSLWAGSLANPVVDGIRSRFPTQVHTSVSGIFVKYVWLNTRLSPFDNRDARRALAYALDRGDLTSYTKALGSDAVTCQVLPPDFPGYQPYCPYTLGADTSAWRAPDIDKARALVDSSGTKGTRVVLYSWDGSGVSNTARGVVATLDRLGYRATVKVLPPEAYFPLIGDPRNRVQAGMAGWGADYPAASTFLDSLLSCSSYRPNDPLNNLNPGGFCNRTIDWQIKLALQRQTTDPARASQLWAAIDRAVVDEAPIVPYGHTVQHDFVSRRVGNYQTNPQYGELIAQLWVQ